MADKPIVDDAEQEVEAQFIDPGTTMLLAGFGWYVIQAMFQAVCGWLGIQLFKKIWKRIRRLWRKDKDDDEGSPSKISEEESAASVVSSLSR
jgi:hypothetical protein